MAPITDYSSKARKTHDNRERARQWLTKGGILHEDSDDELGHEDLPWEWIYEVRSDTDENNDHEDSTANDGEAHSNRRRSSRAAVKQATRRIIGARMGSFECRLGQVVLLKSPEAGKDWIGIITEFLDEEDEENEEEMIKSANIMWFASPDEFLSTKNKKRADALPNEQYLTTDFNVNPLTSINGKANVMSKDAFYAKYPNGAPPKDKAARAEYNKCIVCRRGVNQLQGKYTEEFIWEDVYKEDEQSVYTLIDMVKTGLKTAKKRKTVDKDVSMVTGDAYGKMANLDLRSIWTQSTTIVHRLPRGRSSGRLPSM
jgi:origin recognition complex subunit 1